jgi:hypothetical protein
MRAASATGPEAPSTVVIALPTTRSIAVWQDFVFAPIDQYRADCAEPGSAAEFRAVQADDLPEDPRERGLCVPAVKLDVGAVDDKLHLRPHSIGT